VRPTSIDAVNIPDSMFRNIVFAYPIQKALAPGETVTFVLGAGSAGIGIQKYVDHAFEFHISTDVDGDGTYKGIAESPRLDIIPQKSHHFISCVPSMVEVGKPFEMQIRAEDEFFNLATNYNGIVKIIDEKGKTVLENIQLKNGIAVTSVAINYEGPQRFRVSDKNLNGRSNPCRVFCKLPADKIYWGDIHGHTNISDGLGDNAYDYFAFGRDVAHLDVCALTDHGHFNWPQTIDAVKKFYAPGKYVTILAQEAGAGSDGYNLYYKHDDTPHIRTWPDRIDVLLRDLYDQFNKKDPEIITGPHYFSGNGSDSRYPFECPFDNRIERFVELCSVHGTNEYLGNPRPAPAANNKTKFMQYGLAKGLRFGVIGSGDGHDSHPGRTICGPYHGGLAAFMAPELTREAIWNALWNYKVYASSFDRIYLEFTINNQPMGSDITVKSGSRLKVHYYVIGQTDEVKVFLIRNNEEYKIDSTDKGIIEVNLEDTPIAKDNFYYLRVVQDNGERAWSTPIWVTLQK
jgi:hypothetical protein